MFKYLKIREVCIKLELKSKIYSRERMLQSVLKKLFLRMCRSARCFAQSLGLIIARDRSTSGHVVQASLLPIVLLGYDTEKARKDTAHGRGNLLT